MSLAHWEIEHGATVGQGGKIIVNDQDVTKDVESFQITALKGEVTTLTLWVKGQAGSLKGEGIVEISSLLVQAIDELDPEEIEAEALARQGWDSGQSIVSTVIDLIKEKL